MTHITTLVVAFKTLTLTLGGLITYFSFRAYRRTGADALRAFAIGFGVVTLGALFAGAADQLLQAPSDYALAIESALTAVGFGIIVYSLYVE